MPFSSGRSVRAPASNATRTVSARVPGIAMLWTGRPLVGTVVVLMVAMSSATLDRRLRQHMGDRGQRLAQRPRSCQCKYACMQAKH